MNKEIIAKSKAQIKNKWFKTKEDELDIALNIIDELEQQCRKQKKAIDKAIEFSNKNWGHWCSNHCAYMTELQNILKEVSE